MAHELTDCALLDCLLRSEGEAGLGGTSAGKQFCDVFAQGGPVFEAVAGSPSDQQDILHLRVMVDEEVSIRSILILAHAALDQRSISESRESLGKNRSDLFDRFARNNAGAGIRIEGGTVPVRCDSEA